MREGKRRLGIGATRLAKIPASPADAVICRDGLRLNFKVQDMNLNVSLRGDTK
jgi:hypothetical protein